MNRLRMNRRRRRNGNNNNNNLNKNFNEDLHGHPERNPYVRNDFNSLLVFRGLIVPDHYYTHLNYTTISLLLVNGTVAGASYFYRGNDCFDPDFTGTGHQPMGFDQMTALWSKFRVHGSRFEVKPILSSQVGNLVIMPTLSNTSPSTIQDITEEPYSRLLPITSSIIVQNQKLSAYVETRKMFGYPNITQDDVFVGNSTTSPLSVFYWLTRFESFDNTTITTTRVDVKLTMDVEFFNRVPLSQS